MRTHSIGNTFYMRTQGVTLNSKNILGSLTFKNFCQRAPPGLGGLGGGGGQKHVREMGHRPRAPEVPRGGGGIRREMWHKWDFSGLFFFVPGIRRCLRSGHRNVTLKPTGERAAP